MLHGTTAPGQSNNMLRALAQGFVGTTLLLGGVACFTFLVFMAVTEPLGKRLDRIHHGSVETAERSELAE
jgi:hypothetical protein